MAATSPAIAGVLDDVDDEDEQDGHEEENAVSYDEMVVTDTERDTTLELQMDANEFVHFTPSDTDR